jgi:hypothetical protein
MQIVSSKFFVIIFVFFVITSPFELIHPTVPTLFNWRIDTDCLSFCQLNVTDKQSNVTMNFAPNTNYLSCYYTSNYKWDIICSSNDCNVAENLLLLEPQILLYATKIPNTLTRNVFGLVVINIPSCDTIRNNECLFVEFDITYSSSQLKYYGKPILRYYGKNNFDCNPHSTDANDKIVPFIKTQVKYGDTNYNSKFKLGCYSDKYLNVDAIANNDNYYFQINGWVNIKYSIGSDSLLPIPIIQPLIVNNSQKFEILFGVFFCISVILGSVILCVAWILYYIKRKNGTYTQVQLYDNESQVESNDNESQVELDDNESQVELDDNESQVELDDNESQVFLDNKKSQVELDDNESQVFLDDKKSPVK